MLSQQDCLICSQMDSIPKDLTAKRHHMFLRKWSGEQLPKTIFSLVMATPSVSAFDNYVRTWLILILEGERLCAWPSLDIATIVSTHIRPMLFLTLSLVSTPSSCFNGMSCYKATNISGCFRFGGVIYKVLKITRTSLKNKIKPALSEAHILKM